MIHNKAQQLLIQIAQNGKYGLEFVTAILNRFGAGYLQDVPEAQWPAIAQMAQRVLKEGYDPRASEEPAAEPAF